MLKKALKLLKIFNDNNYEAYLVGGFVRDYVMGRTSSDIDICTNATPMEIKNLFKDAFLPQEVYGAVHITYGELMYEVTTFRMDLEYSDKRSPSKIMYTDNLIIDLKRRDFIMNTLCMDKDGNIIDHLNATTDIKNKIIRCVGDPEERFKEDPLRILRAIRFATELNFKLDDSIKKAIENNKKLLNTLSYFRKKQELNRIFSSPNKAFGISILKQYKLDKYLGINLSNDIENTNDPIGIWAQVNPSDKYQFTSLEKDYLNSILRLIKKEKITNKELYEYGPYLCSIAAQILKKDEVDIQEKYERLPIKNKKEIKLKPIEIINILNLENKSKIKDIISTLESKILNNELLNDEEILKKYILDMYKK